MKNGEVADSIVQHKQIFCDMFAERLAAKQCSIAETIESQDCKHKN